MKSREAFGWLLVIGLLAAFAVRYLPRHEQIDGAVRVVDGDSMYVGDIEVRLFGVDAFEGRQVCIRGGNPWGCGEAAADELRRLTDGRAVTCQKRDTDSYGRSVAVCSNGAVDLGAEIARAGLALAYREFSNDYVDEETEAHTARRGAWAGDFIAPWDYRRGPNAQRTARQPALELVSSCRGTGIKGNISQPSGERIYHTHESSSYAETRIDEAAGERWFCTEQEARNAGWRARR